MRNLSEYISEAVSRRSKVYVPEQGDSIEEIVELLQKQGVTGRNYSVNLGAGTPPPGKLMYVVGTQKPGNKKTYWVRLANNIEHLVGGLTVRRSQVVIVRTEPGEKSIFTDGTTDGKEKDIDFDTAIDLMEEMVLDPKRPVRLK